MEQEVLQPNDDWAQENTDNKQLEEEKQPTVEKQTSQQINTIKIETHIKSIYDTI